MLAELNNLNLNFQYDLVDILAIGSVLVLVSFFLFLFLFFNVVTT